MKATLTGWNGFLARKLREDTSITWSYSAYQSNALCLFGSPIFTQPVILPDQAQQIHQYVKGTMALIDTWPGYIVFASTTAVNDIHLDHIGSTAYNLSKLFLENYIINRGNKYLILRIGNIVSTSSSDIDMMKSDRIQQRIRRKDFSNIPLIDDYLFVDHFVERTVEYIKEQRDGILHYELQPLKLSQLIKLETP